MKKYIRTKNRIGERLEPDEECPEVENEHWLGIVNGLIHKDTEPIIAEADTIEELCDEFVIVRNGEEPTILINYDNLSLLKARVVKDNQKVYGAIWTDKGLIYVAKMNEKGELELI